VRDVGSTDRLAFFRHCERSEAIHIAPSRTMDCFAALAMTVECGNLARRANNFVFTEVVSSPKIKNISLYPKEKSRYIFAYPVPPEGRIMIARIVGTGRGGRW
jgi:hypothetical protein